MISVTRYIGGVKQEKKIFPKELGVFQAQGWKIVPLPPVETLAEILQEQPAPAPTEIRRGRPAKIID